MFKLELSAWKLLGEEEEVGSRHALCGGEEEVGRGVAEGEGRGQQGQGEGADERLCHGCGCDGWWIYRLPGHWGLEARSSTSGVSRPLGEAGRGFAGGR